MGTAVILNLPEHGHMNATYPVVQELVRRGERVIYYATEPFRGAVEATGAEFASYKEAFEAPAHVGGLYSVMAFLMGYAERILPSLLKRLSDDPPDYLLIDSMCIWGALLGQITGIPAIMMSSVLVPNPDTVSPAAMLELAYGRAPKEVILHGIDALNTYLLTSQRIDRLYRTESPDIVQFFANRQDCNILFTSREFHLAGDTYGDAYRFVGPSVALSGEEDAGLIPQGDGPLIYISLGTIFNQQVEFYRTCFGAFGDSRFRVVLSIGAKVDRELLGPAPDNFVVREFVPQLSVLEKASLFITHAGMNSASEALWHGVPLLMFPQHGDQYLVAARVSELGAGLTLTPDDAQPRRLRELADRVIQDGSFRAEARRIGDSFRAAGGYRRAADEILAFASKAASLCLQSA
jgi:MGT family glycosyltransferase